MSRAARVLIWLIIHSNDPRARGSHADVDRSSRKGSQDEVGGGRQRLRRRCYFLRWSDTVGVAAAEDRKQGNGEYAGQANDVQFHDGLQRGGGLRRESRRRSASP